MTRPSAGGYRDALRHRDFATMLTAFLIDQIGSWAYNVVLIVYVYDRTGSAACPGTNTCPMAKPSANMSSRIHHRLGCAPIRAISPIDTTTPARPTTM